jgi:hypothetical protein
MIITPSHPEAPRYKARKGSEWVNRLVHLDTETLEYIRVDENLDRVPGVCDAVYYRPSGQDEWEKIDG